VGGKNVFGYNQTVLQTVSFSTLAQLPVPYSHTME